MTQEGIPAGPGEVYPLLNIKGVRLLSAPSQTSQLEPGNQRSWGELRVEEQAGEEREVARGQGG
jgi:hypothetical protein